MPRSKHASMSVAKEDIACIFSLSMFSSIPKLGVQHGEVRDQARLSTPFRPYEGMAPEV